MSPTTAAKAKKKKTGGSSGSSSSDVALLQQPAPHGCTCGHAQNVAATQRQQQPVAQQQQQQRPVSVASSEDSHSHNHTHSHTHSAHAHASHSHGHNHAHTHSHTQHHNHVHKAHVRHNHNHHPSPPSSNPRPQTPVSLTGAMSQQPGTSAPAAAASNGVPAVQLPAGQLPQQQQPKKRSPVPSTAPLNSVKQSATAALGSVASAPSGDVWYRSDAEEKQRIREFWLQLGEEDRKTLVKQEKEAVMKKIKEQQKHTCSCETCQKKKNLIEEELELLYDAYYDELENFAQLQSAQDRALKSGQLPPVVPVKQSNNPYSKVIEPQHYCSNHRHHHHHHHHNHSKDSCDAEDGDYGDDYDEDCESFDVNDYYPPPQRSSIFDFGSGLTVKDGGILTVAEDFLKNDGRKFLDLMEQLADRKIKLLEEEQDLAMNPPSQQLQQQQHQQEMPVAPNLSTIQSSTIPSAHPADGGDLDDEEEYDEDEEEDEDYIDDEDLDGEEDDDVEDDEYDDEDEEDIMTEEQRMEEGRRMFQIFAAKMFEQRVLTAYREKVAYERQNRLLQELEEEERLKKEKEEAKQMQKEKKKAQKNALKQQKEEEKLRKEKEKQMEEEALRQEKEKKAAEDRTKREAERAKREAERLKKEEAERARREAERLRKEEQMRKQKEAEERKAKAREEKERVDRENRERKEREKEANRLRAAKAKEEAESRAAAAAAAEAAAKQAHIDEEQKKAAAAAAAAALHAQQEQQQQAAATLQAQQQQALQFQHLQQQHQAQQLALQAQQAQQFQMQQQQAHAQQQQQQQMGLDIHGYAKPSTVSPTNAMRQQFAMMNFDAQNGAMQHQQQQQHQFSGQQIHHHQPQHQQQLPSGFNVPGFGQQPKFLGAPGNGPVLVSPRQQSGESGAPQGIPASVTGQAPLSSYSWNPSAASNANGFTQPMLSVPGTGQNSSFSLLPTPPSGELGTKQSAVNSKLLPIGMRPTSIAVNSLDGLGSGSTASPVLTPLVNGTEREAHFSPFNQFVSVVSNSASSGIQKKASFENIPNISPFGGSIFGSEAASILDRAGAASQRSSLGLYEQSESGLHALQYQQQQQQQQQQQKMHLMGSQFPQGQQQSSFVGMRAGVDLQGARFAWESADIKSAGRFNDGANPLGLSNSVSFDDLIGGPFASQQQFQRQLSPPNQASPVQPVLGLIDGVKGQPTGQQGFNMIRPAGVFGQQPGFGAIGQSQFVGGQHEQQKNRWTDFSL